MEYIQFEYFQWKKDVQSNKWDMQQSALISLQSVYSQKYMKGHCSLVAGAWTEREKMYHGGSFLKLAHDNV